MFNTKSMEIPKGSIAINNRVKGGLHTYTYVRIASGHAFDEFNP